MRFEVSLETEQGRQRRARPGQSVGWAGSATMPTWPAIAWPASCRHLCSGRDLFSEWVIQDEWQAQGRGAEN